MSPQPCRMFAKFLISICIYNVGAQELFPSIPVVLQLNVSDLCEKHSAEYADNLKNMTLWAYEMMDSSSKSTTGVLRGSQYNLGNFWQCLSSRAPFPTQYCLVEIKANIPKPQSNRHPFSIYYEPYESVVDKLYNYEDVSKEPRNIVNSGWCTPASCSPSELKTYLNENLNHSLGEENVTYSTQVPEILCRTSDDGKRLDSVDIAFCTLVLVLAALVIMSTVWDFKCNGKKARETLGQKLFMAFSARKNFLDLNKLEGSDKALSVLYGIKTFSIFMIIIDHRFAFFIGSIVSNVEYMERMYRNPLCSFIFHGDLFVDTFFVISGVLVVYNLMALYDKKFVNPGLIVFMRYIRLTPAYAFVIFYYCSLLYHSGDGPLWKFGVGPRLNDCRKNWWLNLLYLSTYIDSEHMCMAHSWYLPCDFHYFILAVGLVLLMKKQRKLGMCVFFLLSIISVLVPFGLKYIYKRPAFYRFFPDNIRNIKRDRDFLLTYIKSHARATPYFVGMFAGYLYYRLKNIEYKVSMLYSTILVLMSTFLLLACLFAGSVYYDPFHTYDALESATYGALHRAVWALGTLGIMFASSYGTFEFLYKCLSWRCWIPLSKLVFGAYLTHFSFQIRAAHIVVNPSEFNFFDVVTYGLSDIILAFLCALGLYLTVEAPVKIIIKTLLFPSKLENKNGEQDVGHVKSETRL